MSTRRKSLNSRLSELEELVVVARTHERDVERDHVAAQAEVARISEARLEAFAIQDEAAAATLALEREQAERTVADFAERAEGARRAVLRAEVEASTFAAANLQALLRERVPQAQEAVKAVTDALEALDAAHAAWHAIEADSMQLLRLAGQDTRSQPRFPERLADLVRDARRVGGADVPLPLSAAVAPDASSAVKVRG
jgi:hypothetical protein